MYRRQGVLFLLLKEAKDGPPGLFDAQCSSLVGLQAVIKCNCCAYECTLHLVRENLTFRMTVIQIIRIVFGTPASDAAVSSMTRWLDSHCRDWRRSDAGSEVAVDLILTESMEAKSFRPLMAMHVKNWGFTRKRYARSNYQPMSIDDYLKGPPSLQTQVLVFHFVMFTTKQRLEQWRSSRSAQRREESAQRREKRPEEQKRPTQGARLTGGSGSDSSERPRRPNPVQRGAEAEPVQMARPPLPFFCRATAGGRVGTSKRRAVS